MSEAPDGYELEYEIGKGGFNTVWKALDKSSETHCAIKKLDKKSQDLKKKELFFNEIEVMKNLMHKNIVQFYSLKSNQRYDFLIMEYIEGVNLKQYIDNKGKMSEQVARHYFIQILDAIDYFHKKTGLLHRDIKADNIMINTKTKKIKIIDFGLAGIYRDDAPTQFCGSPKYVAPEVYERLPYGEAADVWSLGINLFFMVTGYLPFDEETLTALSLMVRKAQPKYPLLMNESLRELISMMLAKNPKERPTIDMIREHSWFKGETIVQPRQLSKRPRALTKTSVAVKSTPASANDSIIEKLVATGRFIPIPKEKHLSTNLLTPTLPTPKKKHIQAIQRVPLPAPLQRSASQMQMEGGKIPRISHKLLHHDIPQISH